jgi:hypothetical protein
MNRKKILLGLFIWAALALIIFLAFCFVAWEMNPGNWNINARYFFSILALLAIAPSVGVPLES